MIFDTEMPGHSPVEKVCFRGHEVYVKRDDLLEDWTSGENAFNGNKARKLHYYLSRDFPTTDQLVSYGSAQSNMLFSLSVLASIKGWKLDFYVDHIAKHLRDNPRGNYAAALGNGANIIEVGPLLKDLDAVNTEDYVKNHVLPTRENSLYIPEGGRNQQSELGLKKLASELIDWLEKSKVANPKLMLPSGTGTTAFYLQKHLPYEVLTCACVGDTEYLQKQFSGLDDNSECHPTILSLNAGDNGICKKYHFGKLYPEFLEIWQEVKEETGITFELLYDPLGWLCMLDYIDDLDEEAGLIYLHQGGCLGNDTMLQRYQRQRNSN